MAVVNNSVTSAAGLFKKVYGDLKDILPEGYVALELFKFDERKKAGSLIAIPVVTTAENGVTFGDGGQVTFADAQAGSVKEAQVTPYECFISSGILTSALSRSAKEGESSVKKASATVVKNNLKSHMRFLEQAAMYGQDTVGLGSLSYDTVTFRGATLTAGACTVGGVTFATGGVNTSAKKVLIAVGQQSSGIWLGSEGMEVEEWTAGAVVAGGASSGKVVSVDLHNGIIELDFTPTAASGANSHYLVLKQCGLSGMMAGVKKILTNASTLFNINAAAVSLFRGVQATISGKLTWAKLMDKLSIACNQGLSSDVTIIVLFESWATLLAEQSALRSYDQSYDPSELSNGAKSLSFSFINGAVMVKPSRFCRRGDAFIISNDGAHRYGSCDVSMKVPGLDSLSDGSMLQQPVTTNVFVFRSYSDQAIFMDAPAQNVYISGINPESAS